MLHQLFCVGRMTKLKNDEVAPRLIFMAWGCVLLLIKNMAGVFPLLSFFQFTDYHQFVQSPFDEAVSDHWETMDYLCLTSFKL